MPIHDYSRNGEASPRRATVRSCNGFLSREFALELARLGFNVIIHSFSEEELAPARNEFAFKYPQITVKMLVQDSSVVVDWLNLIKHVEGLNITVLINNVGASPTPFKPLDIISDDVIEKCIRVNSIFPTQFTRNLLPTLIERSPSLILDICSASNCARSGFITVYCGSKAYSLVWSQALYHELKLLKRDVECKAVMTENIQTYGHNVRTTLVTPTAEVSPVQLYLVLIVAGQCMLAGGDMQCIFCCSGFLSL